MSGIYHVTWLQSGSYALDAVVVADSEQEAVEAIGYMHNPSKVMARRVGSADDALHIAPGTVLAQESL